MRTDEELRAAYSEIDRLKSGFDEIRSALQGADPFDVIDICRDVTDTMLDEVVVA